MSRSGIYRTYWTIQLSTQHDNRYFRLDYSGRWTLEHTAYLTLKSAIAGAKKALATVKAAYAREVGAWNADMRPDAAAADGERTGTKHACFTECRIRPRITVREKGDLSGVLTYGQVAQVALEPLTEARCQFREVKKVARLSDQGEPQTVYELGEPGPWTAWRMFGNGGLFLPTEFIAVLEHKTPFAATAEELAAWAAGSQTSTKAKP